jgi:acetolactate synthase I/II/III large subunit
MNVSEKIVELIAQRGVRHVFLVPGGGAMHLNDALIKNEAITPVPLFHEQSAGIAAEYYSRSEDYSFGVCMVTTGPGVTNAITSLMGAWIESVPMLFISGQAKSTDLVGKSGLRQVGVQEVQTLELVRNFTKYAVSIQDCSNVVSEVERALDIMGSGRGGPIWLEVPLDVQSQLVREKEVRYRGPPADNSKGFSRDARDLLHEAKRPLLYVGHGVRLDGVTDVEPLVDKLSLPTVTTWNALDLLPAANLFNFGRPGVVAKRSSNMILQKADLVLCVGTSLNNVLTAYSPSTFAQNAKKIVFNIDAAELDNTRVSDAMRIQMPAGQALTFIEENFPLDSRDDWIQWCVDLRKEFGKELLLSQEDGSNYSHYAAVDTISRSLPAGMPIITGSSGLAIESFYVAFENKSDQRVMHTSGLGSMGYAVPAAIGYLHATSSPKLVCIEGDGSLMMNLQDVPRLFSFKKPVCLIVMNNRGYASIRATQAGYFDGRYLGTGPESGIDFPSIASIAAMSKVDYIKVTNSESFSKNLSHFCSLSERSLIIDVQLKKDETLYPKCSAYFDALGNIKSMPMEDMTPFLPLSRLKSIMGSVSDVSVNARSQSKKLGKEG